MLVLLPLTSLALFVLVVANLLPDQKWRLVFLRGVIIWALCLTAITEILSAVRAISSLGLALSWTLVVLVELIWLYRRNRSGNPLRWPEVRLPEDRWEIYLLGMIAFILLITAIVAWYAPPQNWDSLNYHMPRVAHWAQQKSVQHFATGIITQNYMSPGAEFIILHTFVLTSGDQLANFVEWFAMLGSLIGVSLIAAQLGAGKQTQLIATVLTAAIPMGIVQASSTMTDYVVAFYLVCIAVEALRLHQGEDTTASVLVASAAAGLAMLTKPTAVGYCLPFALFIALILMRKRRWLSFARYGVLAVLLVLALNLGHYSRNFKLYGNPFGVEKRITKLITEEFSLPILISNTLRNASLHAGTPSPHVNKGIYLVVEKVHEVLGIGVKDSRTTHSRMYRVIPPTTHDDLTTNPVHAYLYLVAFFIMIVKRKRFPRLLLLLGFLTATTFILVSTLVQWQLYNGRLHLGFFVLFAPVATIIFAEVLSTRSLRLLALIVFFASWPWLFQIRSRPIIYKPGESFTKSTVRKARWEQYFVAGGHLKKPFLAISEKILESGCTNVGLQLPGNDAEYPLWVLLDAPFSGIWLEWIVDDPNSVIDISLEFQPCAVVMRLCPEERQDFDGLKRVYGHKPTQSCLFLEP